MCRWVGVVWVGLGCHSSTYNVGWVWLVGMVRAEGVWFQCMYVSGWGVVRAKGVWSED